jgi:hypothetical protein
MKSLRAVVAVGALAAQAIVFAPRALPAADHDDTPALKALGRNDARITDLHVFTRDVALGQSGRVRRDLVLALSTNPMIPSEVAEYSFPRDLTLKIFIDRHSPVDFDSDPEATAEYGGTMTDPANCSPDEVFTITFRGRGKPHLSVQGVEPGAKIELFAGLRDDPFIRAPRYGKNVASVVVELPLAAVVGHRGGSTILVWATSSVPGPEGPVGDFAGRALRSQFAENLVLNDVPDPAEQYTQLGMRPDVVIFDTSLPAAFPNGRDLTDDVVDLVGDQRVLSTDCPVPGNLALCDPTANDVPFLTVFPYLAPPQGVAAGTGTTLWTLAPGR